MGGWTFHNFLDYVSGDVTFTAIRIRFGPGATL